MKFWFAEELTFSGFITLNILAEDSANTFKCGLAVASVTNWIYYDTIYTETLPTVEDNLQGYHDSDITTKARKCKGKKLMLIHGTAGKDKILHPDAHK